MSELRFKLADAELQDGDFGFVILVVLSGVFISSLVLDHELVKTVVFFLKVTDFTVVFVIIFGSTLVLASHDVKLLFELHTLLLVMAHFLLELANFSIVLVVIFLSVMESDVGDLDASFKLLALRVGVRVLFLILVGLVSGSFEVLEAVFELNLPVAALFAKLAALFFKMLAFASEVVNFGLVFVIIIQSYVQFVLQVRLVFLVDVVFFTEGLVLNSNFVKFAVN
jgi:hypothetical protein